MNVLAACVMALTFGFVGSMPLAGPIAILAVSRATRRRYGEALRVGLGAAVAEGFYAGVTFWSFTTILARHEVVVPISHGTTAIVLVGVGLRFVVWRPSEKGSGERENKAGTVLLGFTVCAVNPTLLLTWSAAVAFLYSRGLQDPSPCAALPFGLCAAAGVAGWFATLVALFKRYGTKVPQTGLTWAVRAMGLLLVVLGVWSGVKLVRYFEGDREGTSDGTADPMRERARLDSAIGALLMPIASSGGCLSEPRSPRPNCQHADDSVEKSSGAVCGSGGAEVPADWPVPDLPRPRTPERAPQATRAPRRVPRDPESGNALC